jgi:hypothetical protein
MRRATCVAARPTESSTTALGILATTVVLGPGPFMVEVKVYKMGVNPR